MFSPSMSRGGAPMIFMGRIGFFVFFGAFSCFFSFFLLFRGGFFSQIERSDLKIAFFEPSRAFYDF